MMGAETQMQKDMAKQTWSSRVVYQCRQENSTSLQIICSQVVRTSSHGHEIYKAAGHPSSCWTTYLQVRFILWPSEVCMPNISCAEGTNKLNGCMRVVQHSSAAAYAAEARRERDSSLWAKSKLTGPQQQTLHHCVEKYSANQQKTIMVHYHNRSL